MGVTLMHGDSLEQVATLPEGSVHAVVTDPPYGLANLTPQAVRAALTAWLAGDTTFVPDGRGFMSANWDRFVPPPAVWAQCLRVLPPGGHILAFAGARTQDLMGMSLRLAGFELRDAIGWAHGNGMPKTSDVGAQIARAGGPQAEAERWSGWSAGIKPALEPILVARKPLAGTVADTVLAHGAGALNIDATRVPFRGDADENETKSKNRHADFGTLARDTHSTFGDYSTMGVRPNYEATGRCRPT